MSRAGASKHHWEWILHCWLEQDAERSLWERASLDGAAAFTLITN